MMKKNGFTLAEVLITLAIIGVVATMTLPALLTNTGEQQARTALKKAINTLTEAGQMSKAVEGFNYDEIVKSETAPNENTDDGVTQSLVALLRARTAIDYSLTADGKNFTADADGYKGYSETPTTAVYFRDGSSLLFNNQAEPGGTMQDDNMTDGFVITVDTNGKKGPNALSNCKGNKKGDVETGETFTLEEVDVSACKDKSKRVINDRFLIRLRGSIAQPEGAAANWAYQN